MPCCCVPVGVWPWFALPRRHWFQNWAASRRSWTPTSAGWRGSFPRSSISHGGKAGVRYWVTLLLDSAHCHTSHCLWPPKTSKAVPSPKLALNNSSLPHPPPVSPIHPQSPPHWARLSSHSSKGRLLATGCVTVKWFPFVQEGMNNRVGRFHSLWIRHGQSPSRLVVRHIMCSPVQVVMVCRFYFDWPPLRQVLVITLTCI